MDLTGQVAGLLRHVEGARHVRQGEQARLLLNVTQSLQARQGECKRLLLELTARLQGAKIAERRLDRHLAPRFNVLKYLREDELGLSRIIKDLLDPGGEHGQGTSFLEAMLDALPETRGRFGELRNESADPIAVEMERATTTGRRIDFTVDIPTAKGRFCLAFENKPYASDQDLQISDYLDFLHDQYGRRFLLVYLPPVHRLPAESSLPATDRERWSDHFTIMPYTGSDASLANWLASCVSHCDASRVTSFLRDAESFCRQQFGESPMTTDPDTQFVRDYLSENPSHMRAALAVHDAWKVMRAEVCERFLEHLRQAVEHRLPSALPGIEGDFHVRSQFAANKISNLWIYREAWIRYDDLPPTEHGRTAIGFQSHGQGPYDWYWGVRNPKELGKMTEAEKARREEFVATWGRQGLSLGDDGRWWPQWEYVSRYKRWHSIAPELHVECEARGGPITTYYVEGLLKIAGRFIPAIDKLEMVS